MCSSTQTPYPRLKFLIALWWVLCYVSVNRLWVPYSFSWPVTPWVFSCVPLCFQYVPPCAMPCVPLYDLLLAANQCFGQCVPGCFAPSCVPCALAVGLPLRFLVNYTAHFQCFPSCISCVVFFVLLCGRSSCFVAWLPLMFLLYSVCVLMPFLIRYVIFSQCVRSYILCLLSCLF